MNITTMRFPRQLEAEGTVDIIRGALLARTATLWTGGAIEVPVITPTEPLKTALQRARRQGRVRVGLEAILHKLAGEHKGIAHVKAHTDTPYGDRMSRLLFVSDDGTERFYRHIEQLLEAHAPRLLCCRLTIDGNALGSLVTGKEGTIKVVMAEHKDSVSDILRALVAGQEGMAE